jgi:hypothetical protein
VQHDGNGNRYRRDDQKRAIEQWAAAWSARDMERLLPPFTENVV